MTNETSITVVKDADWISFCNKRKVKPWYAFIPALYPRGFYSPSDKTIYMKANQMNNEQLKCHEFGHTEGYDHPTSMLAALRHAIVETKCGTMAFSGVFRFNKTPDDLWQKYNAWLPTAKVIYL